MIDGNKLWTPTKYKLPNEDGYYDVTISIPVKDNKVVYVKDVCHYNTETKNFSKINNSQIVAWMPKIMPYNPDKKEV